MKYRNKLECLQLPITSSLDYHLWTRLEGYHKSKDPQGALLWQASAMPVNVRLGWNLMDVVNTLAYYNTATLTVVKKLKYRTQRIDNL